MYDVVLGYGQRPASSCRRILVRAVTSCLSLAVSCLPRDMSQGQSAYQERLDKIENGVYPVHIRSSTRA